MALGTSFTQITKSGLSSTSAYDTGHINSSGIITATKFVGTLEGNVTSDDWTNTATGISTTINVGIGTTNATSKLTVSGTVTANSFSGGLPITSGSSWRVVTSSDASTLKGETNLQFDGTNLYISDNIIHKDDTNTKIGFPAVDTITAETDGSARLKITNGDLTMLDYLGADKVGIGTNVLVAKLDVKNNSNIPVIKLQDSHYNKYLTIRGGGSPNRMVIDSYEGGGGGADIDLASNGSIKVRIKSDGKVGIGTESPSQVLTVRAGSTPQILLKPTDATPALFVGDTVRTGEGQHLAEYRGNWDGTTVGRMVIVAGDDTGNKDNGEITFNTASAGSTIERLRIKSDGKITVAANSDIRFTNGTWSGEVAGKIQHNSNNLYIQGGTGGIRFRHASSGVNQFSMTNGGNFEIDNGDVVVASGHGIDFSATGDATGKSSETLDDYEIGTWSPTIFGGTTAGSYSYESVRTGGKYTKIGNLVYIEGVLRISAINSAGAGTLNFGGLPYTFGAKPASSWNLGRGIQVTHYGYGTSSTSSSTMPPPHTCIGVTGASTVVVYSYGKNYSVATDIATLSAQYWIYQIFGCYQTS